MPILKEPGAAPDRTIGSYGGRAPGPVVICVCGIHGNEPAGVHAAESVLAALREREAPLRGEFVAIAGNLTALAQGSRYVAKDLNRQWTPDRVEALVAAPSPDRLELEDREQLGIWRALDPFLSRSRTSVFFLDLHTSSGGGPPFATMGDTLRNRDFVSQFPIPVILGLEDQIDGALLEYVNNLGHVTVGVEGGRHDLPTAIDCHIAVLWLSLVAAGSLAPEDVPELAASRASLERAAEGLPRIVEIRYRHSIRKEDGFEMAPGFSSFQPIKRGEIVGRDRRGPVRARESGLVMLPLYQAQGDDGFFLGREVRPFWLRVSRVMRRVGLPALSHWLPGVSRHPVRGDTLIVNTRIARFYPLDLFHLLGYRKRRWQGNLLIVSRRREEFGSGALP